MNKTIWMCASLPLLGVAFYVFFIANHKGAETQMASLPQIGNTERSRDSQHSVNNKTSIPSDESFELRRQNGEVLKNNVNVAMLAVADGATESSQRKKVEFEMKVREPHYLNLFESWKLERGMIEKISTIIWERESRITAHRLELFKNGIDHATVVQRKIDAERQIVDNELIVLLGPDRFEQFSKVDSQLNTRGRKPGLLTD